MDPFSATTGILQIIGQCTAVTIALAKFIAAAKTVDRRLQSFYDDVSTLQVTHETLQRSLETPLMSEAARSTNDPTGQLWSRISVTLGDCSMTLVSITQVLDKINRTTMFGRPLRQILESLNSGDLSRYYDRIQMFNGNLQLTMQMMNITLQISHRDTTTINQRKLEYLIMDVRRTVKDFDERLGGLKRTYSRKASVSLAASSTLVDTSEKDGAVYDNLDKWMEKAKDFLTSASSVASQRGDTIRGGSLLQDDDFESRPANLWRGSEAGIPLTHRQLSAIDQWVPSLPKEPRLLTPSPSDTDLRHTTPSPQNRRPSNATDEVDFRLASSYVENGTEDVKIGNFASAAENFEEALELLKQHDFGERLACNAADVTLMLAQCRNEEGLYEEAIALLKPLNEFDDGDNPASIPPPDAGQRVSADHMLGVVYLKSEQYRPAEEYSLKAFSGRRKLLGEQHPKSIESVQLVIDVYKAMGKQARAKAYQHFLAPKSSRGSHGGGEDSPRSSFTRHNTIPIGNSSPGLTNPSSPQQIFAQLQPVSTIPPLAPSLALVHSDTSPHSIEGPSLEHVRSRSFAEETSSVSSTSRPAARPSIASALTHTSTNVTSESTHQLRPKFLAVKSLAAQSKDKAVDMALNLLKKYDPEPCRILIHRNEEIKKNIKKRGADFGLAATGFGYAPIHFFCELSTFECLNEVELLIEQGVDLGAVRYKPGLKGIEPMTPLQIAIAHRHEQIALRIIKALGDAAKIGRSVPNVDAMVDNEGFTPLLASCRRGQVEVVRELLAYGSGISGIGNSKFSVMWYGNSLLSDACARCDVDMVRMLLDYNNSNSSFDTGYHEAARPRPRNDIGTLAQQDKFGKTPLMYAVISSNLGTSAMREAKKRRRLRCLRLLLEHSAIIAPTNVGMDSGAPSIDMILLATDEKGFDVFAHSEREDDHTAINDLLSQYARFGRSRGPPKELEGDLIL